MRLLIIILLFSVTAQAQQVAKTWVTPAGWTAGLLEYRPPGIDTMTRKPALIIYSHGNGEASNYTAGQALTAAALVDNNEIPKLLTGGTRFRFQEGGDGPERSFVVLSFARNTGQSPFYESASNQYVDWSLQYMRDSLANLVDTFRIYLVGLSGGGAVGWNFPGRSVADAQKIAAVVQICPTNEFATWCNIAAGNVPIWAFHADDDGTTSASGTESQINQMITCGITPTPIFTNPATGGHGIWDEYLDTNYVGSNGMNVYEWMLQYTRAPGGGNQLPIAVAGNDQTITLPTNSVSVNGSSSSDADGTITDYLWEKISGPPTFNIVSPASASTTINNLVEGVYVFRLTVTDDDSDFDNDDITITVNPAVEIGYQVGALSQKTISGINFLYYFPDTAQRSTLKQYFVFAMVDSSGKDSAYAIREALGKKIIEGWNGKQPLSNGTDTACFNVLIQITHSNGSEKNQMETAIQWALDSIPNQCFDTANRTRNIMTGIGRAAELEICYLLDEFVNLSQPGTLKFYGKFGKYTSVDHRDNGRLSSSKWDSIAAPFKSWWFYGGGNNYPYLPTFSEKGWDSADNYNAFPLTKKSIISGQNYTAFTHDSVYSNVGTGAENNMFRWWADDAEFGYPGDKIIINKNWYADFSGADGYASRSTFYYFDSEWDVKAGVTNTVDTTDGKTYHKIAITHRRHGQRDVWVNFQKPFVITAVYGKRRNASTLFPDTVTMFSRGSRINNLDFLAADKRPRTDYLFRAISIGNSDGWEKLWEGFDTTQYMLLNLRYRNYLPPESPFPQATDGNYQDYVFYGYELPGGVAETKYNVASEDSVDSWTNRKKSNLRKHSGANFSNVYYIPDYDDLQHIRGYNQQIFHWKSKYPTNSMDMQLGQDTANWPYHNEQVIAREPDKFNYISLNGTNQFVADTQTKRIYEPSNPLYGGDNFKPVDSIGLDPAYPQHYKTLASNMTMTAELFGYDNVKSAKVRTHGSWGRPAPGEHKIYRALEIGNEDDADVNDSAYMTPIERAAMFWACYNGMMNTMNGGDTAEFGIKFADPGMKVISGAFIGWNYLPMCHTMIAAKIIAQADSLPFDIVAGHIYHADRKRFPGASSDEQNIEAHGIPPEMLGYPADIDTMARALRRFSNRPPERIELTNNEWGWDKTYQRPECTSDCDSNVFAVSSYGLPYNNMGYDSSRWHSELLIRGTSIFAASHYNYSAVFTFSDDRDPQAGGIVGPYTFSGINGHEYKSGVTFNIDSIEYTKARYHYRGWLRRFKNFYVDQKISEVDGGLWAYRWQNDSAADEKMYQVWEGDSNQTGVTYNIPVASDQTIIEWVPSETSIIGTEIARTPTGGFYTVNGGIAARFFIVSGEEPENQAPTAAAGTDQSITLPTSQVTVNGSGSNDPDGTISTYLWSKISGPSTFTITNPNNSSTTITGLVQGTYVFRLTVTDNDSATGTDDITITVGAAPIVPGSRKGWFRGNLRLNKFIN